MSPSENGGRSTNAQSTGMRAKSRDRSTNYRKAYVETDLGFAYKTT